MTKEWAGLRVVARNDKGMGWIAGQARTDKEGAMTSRAEVTTRRGVQLENR
jgi:hypothetical protein